MTSIPTRTALVTGGNRGIGLAIVKGLAAKGIHVLLASRNPASGKEEADKINGTVTAVALDLTSRDGMNHQM